ncbi:MAG TPA: DUF2238 domain-containing protein [Thermodesulfobacteriota bacterium]|nr:DUF2238 domain-containing protein [Thermodesulfobacteriota bacterium]
MLATTTTAVEPALGRTRLPRLLLGWYAAVWTLLAIAPADRFAWVLENVLPVLFVALLVATYRRFPLSDRSYVLIALFLSLHAVGAYYTYQAVPVGEWARQGLGLRRNHYDRLVHLAFGLLMTYPIREVLVRVAAVRGGVLSALAVAVTLALSALYEIVEWGSAEVLSPQATAAFLGLQGDLWDAQKDMALAACGALLSVLLMAAAAKRPGRPRS